MSGFFRLLYALLPAALRYIFQHIKNIIGLYNGSIPLAYFLKNYFKAERKLGSRDRKILADMAYCWYRAEAGLDKALDFEDKLYQAILLCSKQPKTLAMLPPYFLEKQPSFNMEALFVHHIDLSQGIDRTAWLSSMLLQPDLFIRIRKNKQHLLSTLRDANIPFREMTGNCLSLPNGTAIDKLLPEADYVVQDASSQHTGYYFNAHSAEEWYDCCSGAGGKSLMLMDKCSNIKLTVSDLRESILHNLKQRFRLYGIKPPAIIQVDASKPDALKHALLNKHFDQIICDVPCSGSGTWARTPEQLYFFDPAILNSITQTQAAIAINAASHLKPGGTLYYITCSVFKAENEDIVNQITGRTGLQIDHQELVNGIAEKADSLFISVLKRH